jgi:hypothetical protein
VKWRSRAQIGAEAEKRPKIFLQAAESHAQRAPVPPMAASSQECGHPMRPVATVASSYASDSSKLAAACGGRSRFARCGAARVAT